MPSLLKLAAAAALMTMWSPVANAQSEVDYTFPEREIGVWLVYGYKDKCWMLQETPVNGTILSFSLSKRTSNLYISGENRSWTSLESMKQYDLRLELGSVDTTVTGTALQQEKLGPMLGIFIPPEKVNFFAAMPGAQRIRVSMEGKTMFDIPLQDRGPALEYFEKCARTLRVGPFIN